LIFLFRIAAVTAVIGLAACSSSPPPPPVNYQPLNYSYLPPITLKVATVNIQNDYVPDPGAATLIGEDPEPPATALLGVATQRLVANGTPGTATFTIENASIEEANGNLTGTLTARLDVISADGRRNGFTEASVSHTETAPDPDAAPADVQAALYGMTKELMDEMNVQMQYQIQRNLSDWVVYAPNAAAPPLNSGTASSGAIIATPLPGSAVIPGAPPAAPVVPAAPVAPAQPNAPLPLGSGILGTLPVNPPAPAVSQ
jgi:hypothetical protein